MQFVKQFDWIALDKPVEWNDLNKTAGLLMEKGIFPAEMHAKLCSNYGVLNANVNAAQIAEYKEKKLTVSERWVGFFKKCAKEGFDYKPLAIIVSYILTIPGNFIYCYSETNLKLVINWWKIYCVSKLKVPMTPLNGVFQS